MAISRLVDNSQLEGKRVFVRVDFNVPIANGKVANDFRIRAVKPTIDFLKKAGAKVILGSHLETKEGSDMTVVSNALKNIVEHVFVSSTDLVVINEHIERMRPGDVTLLQNLRFWRGEEMAEEHFATDFSRLADLYVNEAFSVSHRKHASIILFPKFLPSCAGIRFLEEMENLSRAFAPEQPFLFILGGAKFETKEPLVRKFLDTATNIFIGGALANDFFLALGYEVGRSLISNPPLQIPEDILRSLKVILPIDVTVETSNKQLLVKKPNEVATDEKIVDVGPDTIELLRHRAEEAKLIVWNGPLGIYEQGIVKETEELAIAVAESRGVSIVGGGDTIAAISRLSLETAFDFVSTGGGAMLEFLNKETLPGIEALQI